MTSVKNRQGRPAPDRFFQNKSFLFCNSRHIGYHQCLLISIHSTVFYAFVGHGFPSSHRWTPHAALLYNIFYELSSTISCLNHILGFSPKGVSIPTCFTHLHTYFSCHATMSLNLYIVPFYRAHHRTPNTVSINHVLTTYIEHQHSVDLPCPHNIHRTPTQCQFTMV